jgi:hypothetical protein
LTGVGIAAGEYDRRALGAKQFDDLEADAAGAAGYDCGLSLKT